MTSLLLHPFLADPLPIKAILYFFDASVHVLKNWTSLYADFVTSWMALAKYETFPVVTPANILCIYICISNIPSLSNYIMYKNIT